MHKTISVFIHVYPYNLNAGSREQKDMRTEMFLF